MIDIQDNNQQGNNSIYKLNSLYRSIATALAHIFHHKKSDIIMPIPEKIKYIQRYQQGKITPQDIIDIIHIPGYTMSGIYFACKYLVQNHHYTLHDIQPLIGFFNTSDNNKAIDNAKNRSIGLLQDYQSLTDTIDIYTKLRLQIVLGASVTTLVEDTFLKNRHTFIGSTPVIALYAGLQLLPFLQKHFANQTWIFVDDNVHEVYIYQNGLRKLQIGEKIMNNNLTIIDDTYWTGNSYNTIKHILSIYTDGSNTFNGLFALEKK